MIFLATPFQNCLKDLYSQIIGHLPEISGVWIRHKCIHTLTGKYYFLFLYFLQKKFGYFATRIVWFNHSYLIIP